MVVTRKDYAQHTAAVTRLLHTRVYCGQPDDKQTRILLPPRRSVPLAAALLRLRTSLSRTELMITH